jgi:hypothetical protein
MSKQKMYFLPKSKVAVSTGLKMGMDFDEAKAPAGNQYDTQNRTAEYQMWGADNLRPKKNREKLEKSTTALPLITRWAETMFGRGIFYYEEKRVNGRIELQFPEYKEIDEFLDANRAEYMTLERIMDFKVHGNIFCELIANKLGTKIVRMQHLEAEFSRFGKINEKNEIENILYKGDWTGTDKADEIPYLDAKQLLLLKDKVLPTLKSKKKFAIHSCFPSPGHSLYAVPPHNAIFEDDGWLTYAVSVPKIMNAINKNAQNIRHHVRIPENYWSLNHKGWENLTQEEREAYIDEKMQEMDDWFVGLEKAGKTFYTHYNVDPVTGKPMTGWEIQVLDDKDKKDKFLTSVQEADVQLARAIGVDVSMAGIQATGGKLGAGSGSDKEAGFDNTKKMSYAAALVIFDQLYHVGRINGWPKVKFGFIDPTPVINSLENEA